MHHLHRSSAVLLPRRRGEAQRWVRPALAALLVVAALTSLLCGHRVRLSVTTQQPAKPGARESAVPQLVTSPEDAACLHAVADVCGAALSGASRLALAAAMRCTSLSDVRRQLAALPPAPAPARSAFCELLNGMAAAEVDPKSATLTKLQFTNHIFSLAAHSSGGSFALQARVMRTYGSLLGVRYDFGDRAGPWPWPPLPAEVLNDQRGALAALDRDGVAPLMQLPRDAVARILAGLADAEFAEKDHLTPTGGTYPSVRGVRPDKAAPESTFYILADENDALRVPDLQRLVFDPSLLALVQQALGAAPILARLDVWFTRARTRSRGAAEEVRDFTKFHRDYNFVRSFKFFLYLSDVDTSTGPYQFVAGSYRGTGGLGAPRDGEFYTRQQVAAAYPASAVREMTGSAGLVFCSAGTNLHRGKPLQRGHRAIVQFEFTGSLLGGTDGGFVVPLLRIPAALTPLYEAYPRLFARVKAGYLTFTDARPALPAAPEEEAPPGEAVVFATLALNFNASNATAPPGTAFSPFFTRNANSFLDFTIPALREYCDARGYGFVVETSARHFARHGVQLGWSKMPLLRRVMLRHPRARWVAWIDADTLPLDASRGMEPFLDAAEAAGKHVIVHPQCGRSFGYAGLLGNNVVSTALVLVRNTDAGRAFLTMWESRWNTLARQFVFENFTRNEETDELNLLVEWFDEASDPSLERPLMVLPPNSIMTWISGSRNDTEAKDCYTGRCFPAAEWMAKRRPQLARRWARHALPVFVTFPGQRKEFLAPFRACSTNDSSFVDWATALGKKKSCRDRASSWDETTTDGAPVRDCVDDE